MNRKLVPLVSFAMACSVLAAALSLALFWPRAAEPLGVRVRHVALVPMPTRPNPRAESEGSLVPPEEEEAPRIPEYTAASLRDRPPPRGTYLSVAGEVTETGSAGFAERTLWGLEPGQGWAALGDPRKDQADCVVAFTCGLPWGLEVGMRVRLWGVYRGRTPGGVPLVGAE